MTDQQYNFWSEVFNHITQEMHLVCGDPQNE